MEDIIELLKTESSELIAGFRKASIQGKGTPQEVADFRENYVHGFISNYFPFPHRITKGKIRDSFGSISASIDCLVINPNHPYTIDAREKFSLILADGVDIAIEVKPDISIKSEVERAVLQVQSVKKLRRRESPIVLRSKYSSDIIDYSKQIPSFLFSMKAKNNILDTMKDINEIYEKNGIPKEEWIDFVVINEVGIISNYKFEQIGCAKDKDGNMFVNNIFEEWGDLTLAAFILKMNQAYHATPSILGDILTYYLKDIKPLSLKFYK